MNTPARASAIALVLVPLLASLLSLAPGAQAVTCTGASTAVAQTEGPYYKTGAPARRNLTQAGTVGTPLVLTGQVLDASCRPLAGAKVDFWQADGRGRYDNVGYRLRGTQRTTGTGGYRLTTVIPGQYPGRTEHIHVKITAPGGPTFTTQLYFPDSTHNDDDGIFSPAMLLTVKSSTPGLMRASYTFVLPK